MLAQLAPRLRGLVVGLTVVLLAACGGGGGGGGGTGGSVGGGGGTAIPPTLTIEGHPTSQTVVAGNAATFSVDAVGAAVYQWESSEGGSFASIAGANSASYTTPVASTTRSGTQYRVVVSAGTSSLTSSAATLTVKALPSPPTAMQSATDIVILNDHLSISLDASSGSIKSIVDRASGMNLTNVQQGTYRALWGLNLVATGAQSKPFADNNSSGQPTVNLSNSTTESSVTLVWKGLNFNSGLAVNDATITVKISLKADDTVSRWSFQGHSVGGIKPAELYFPLIGGVGILGSQGTDNRLLVPEIDGRLITDPITARTNFGRLYPSAFMTMQFEAYYNNAAGFIVGTRDTEGYTKAIQWYSPTSPANSAIWQVVHYYPDQPVSNISIPYESVVGVFHGGWTDAADIYRKWALQQPWSQEARLKQLPLWYRGANFARTMCTYSCGNDPPSDLNYATFVQQQSNGNAAFGGSTLSTLWGWETLGFGYYGDWFPPKEGWVGFDSMVSAIHQQNNYLHVLITGSYIDAATALWQTDAARAGAMRNADGSPISVDNHIGAILHTWNFMSPASDFWKQHLATTVSTLASHEVDSIQFDNWPFFEPQDDYSAGHPPGRGGNWQWLAWQQLLAQAIQAGKAIRPSLGIATEGIHELAIPFVTSYTDRDVMSELLNFSNKGAVVPLFPYVYKPLIQSQSEYWADAPSSKPDSFHKLALARALNWGQRAQLPVGPWLSDPALSQSVLNFYIAIGKARAAYSRFLIDGSMLPPPEVVSPTTPVELIGDGGAVGSFSGTASSIQASSWRASTGEIGLVLTNISPSVVTFSLPVDFAKLGLSTGTRYAVKFVTDAGVQSLTTVSVSRAVNVTLQPLQIGMLTVQ